MSLFDSLTKTVEAFETLGYPALLERFVLRNGQPFSKGDIGDRELMEPNLCFANATRSMAAVGPYVEGFVMRGGLPVPIHHAWNAGPGITALDLTLRPPISKKFEGAEYWGVELAEEEVREASVALIVVHRSKVLA